MEFKFSITKNRPGSSHVQRDNWSSRVLSDFYHYVHYRNKDYGNTKRYIDTYSQNGIVYMVINKIAQNTSTLPRNYIDSNGEIIENSQIEEAIKQPNSYQTEIEFRQTLNEYLLTSGNGFILNIQGIGGGNEFTVLDSSRVVILINSIGEVSGYKYTNNLGNQVKYEVEDILHIRLSNNLQIDRELQYWGLSPLKSLWTVVESSNDLFRARASIWKNKGYAGILTNKSDVPLLPKERDELQTSFNEEVGGADRVNGVRVSTGDLNYLQLGMSPADLKLLEGNIDNLRMISSAYKMPSVLFNDVENSTYNNVLESKKDAYTDAYIPLDKKINEKLSEWLSEILGVEEFIVVDTTRIEVLKLTTNEVANKLNNLPNNVAARVMESISLNESRNLVGLEEIDGGEEMLGKPNQKDTTNEDKTTD